VTAAASRVTRRVVSPSARATWRLGQRLGAALLPGDVVALVGDLGAGKTQLVRGACAGAGVDQADVSSPTFAIVQTYRGRLPFHHADLYRLADLDELYATGFTDLLAGDGALVVEWADRVDGWAPAERLEIILEEVAGRPGSRRISLTGTGTRHAALAKALAGVGRARPRAMPGAKVGARLRAKATSKASKPRPRTKAVRTT
jgi:tRNA threonylcarbamoyladenosine biosynthesis protein TsaE